MSAFDVRNVPSGSTLELYISPSCPYCAQAMAYYKERGIAFTAYDAAGDARKRKAMLAMTDGDPTVPAIILNGKYVQSGWGEPPRG